MPDWQRVIVGDAFRAPSRDFNYYRDLFLLLPCLFFTAGAFANLFGGAHDHLPGLKLACLSLLSILLACERLIVFGSALAVCASRGLLYFCFERAPIDLAIAIPSGALLILVILLLKGHKVSYRRWPRGLLITDLLVGMVSLGLSILVLHWIAR